MSNIGVETGSTWLCGARLASGDVRDVRVAHGVIAQVAPAGAGAAEPMDTVVDLTGYVLIPSFVEPHAHLDKALTASRAANPTGDLLGAIAAMELAAPTFTHADIVARAERALATMLSYGTTAVRSHVNVGHGMGMRNLEALIEVRQRWAGLVDLQLVALVGHPLDGHAGQTLRQALAEGADVAGGCPHLDPNPDRAVAVCVDAAGEYGAPLDLHTDETLDPSMLTLRTLADLVARTGLDTGVTASHCVSLGMQSAAVQQAVAEEVAAAGVAVVTLPQTNLYLQGRGRTVATPRGLTAVAALLRAKATVAAGGDNLRDPFHPVGRGDPIEVASLMVTAGHLDEAAALGSITVAARSALGLPTVDIAVGSPADLVALAGDDLLEALGAARAQRLVWRGGRLVAQTRVIRELDLPTDRYAAEVAA